MVMQSRSVGLCYALLFGVGLALPSHDAVDK